MDAAPPENKIADLVDLVHQSAIGHRIVQGPDGRAEVIEDLDNKIVWWKTHAVNSNRFGRMAYELEGLAYLGLEAFRRMPHERAQVIADQIKEIVQVFKYSIDAKSSESKRDGQNSQATLLDRAGRNKVEHVYTNKDAGKRTLADAFLGRRQERDMEEEY